METTAVGADGKSEPFFVGSDNKDCVHECKKKRGRRETEKEGAWNRG